MQRLELVLLMGPQAAGKTTWIRNFLGNHPNGSDWRVVASDYYWTRCPISGLRYWKDDNQNIRSWGTEPIPSHIMAHAWRFAYHGFLSNMEKGIPTIFEGTFSKSRDRKNILNTANYYNYSVDCVCLYPTLYQCAERNENRPDRVPDVILARTYASMQLPTKYEGFRNVEIIGAQ